MIPLNRITRLDRRYVYGCALLLFSLGLGVPAGRRDACLENVGQIRRQESRSGFALHALHQSSTVGRPRTHETTELRGQPEFLKVFDRSRAKVANC